MGEVVVVAAVVIAVATAVAVTFVVVVVVPVFAVNTTPKKTPVAPCCTRSQGPATTASVDTD